MGYLTWVEWVQIGLAVSTLIVCGFSFRLLIQMRRY